MTINFHDNYLENYFKARHDMSSQAMKILDEKMGVPRQHIRVGEFIVIIGGDRHKDLLRAWTCVVAEQYGGDVPPQENPTDRQHRLKLLSLVEARIKPENFYYKRVLAAIRREREHYMPKWHMYSLETLPIKVNVRPSASIEEARRAYLDQSNRVRLPRGATFTRV